MRLYGLALRYSIEDKAGYFSDRLERPVIFLLWHNRIANMPVLYERRCRRHGRPACVLTSTTPEGALLALFLSHFGLAAVRVATSPRTPNAMRELAERMEKRQDVFVTPDGPLGPRYHLKPGALWFAQNTGRPVVPLHVESSRYVRFKSWDGFAIALPFARITVVLDEPCWISANCTGDEFESERARIEQIMIDGLLMDRAVAAK
jgi:lysophospholipid acyltransferase (LPLAT)-like uncharacterized protein